MQLSIRLWGKLLLIAALVNVAIRLQAARKGSWSTGIHTGYITASRQIVEPP